MSAIRKFSSKTKGPREEKLAARSCKLFISLGDRWLLPILGNPNGVLANAGLRSGRAPNSTETQRIKVTQKWLKTDSQGPTPEWSQAIQKKRLEHGLRSPFWLFWVKFDSKVTKKWPKNGVRSHFRLENQEYG